MKMVNFFELNVKEHNSENKVHQFKKNIEITIQHTQEELAGLDIDSLYLYYLDEDKGEWIPIPCEFDRKTLTLTAKFKHFSYFGEQANPLQSGPGKVTTAQVGLHSGTATYSYPLELPPGPGGFTPSVSLNYNSGSVDGMKNKRDVGSWVGIGWSLNLGRISYNAASGNYNIDLNGVSHKIVPNSDSIFYTQPEEYLKITKDGNTWSVYDKSGNYYRFGGTTDSEQYTDTSDYYRWDLSYWKDTNGNEATVTYVQDIWNNSVRSAYPEYLRYNNNLVEVHFLSSYYENGDYGPVRKDNPISYGTNPVPKNMENRQLDSIEIKVSGNLIRKYNFSYITTDRVYSSDYDGIYYSGKHMLMSITQIGTDGESSLSPTSFVYQYREVFRYANETEYTGNPGNPASITWPFLSAIDSGYGGSISFTYTQIPDTSVLNTWTRQAVTQKIINGGMGTTEIYSYAYTHNPQYKGVDWDQEFRGWNEVIETDADGNYLKHYFYTTGTISGKDAEKLTGKEYQTIWYDSANTLLKTKNYDWNRIDTSQNFTGSMTFYPDASPESSSVDGIVGETTKQSFASLVADVGDGSNDSIESYYICSLAADTVSNIWYNIFRGIFLFDTSGLPDNASITGATLSIYGYSKFDTVGWLPDINIYSSNPASNTTLVNGDYDSLGTVAFATAIGYNDWNTSGYNDFAFNSDGLNAISKTGISKFGTRNANYEVAGSPPTWASGQYYAMMGRFAESGEGYKPKLVVTYNMSSLYKVYLSNIEETIGTKTTRTEYVYDDYGNVITEKRHGDISTTDDDSTIHRVYYANNSTAYIVNKPARERVYATITEDVGGANLKKETFYYYDGNNALFTTPPTKGNLTRLEQKKDASNSISSYSTYDTYGNLLTSQDPNGNTTTWAFDTTYHVYPLTKTMPLIGSESYTYAPGTTNLLSMTDVNGQTTTYEYDTFQRLTKVIKPGDSSASPSVEYQYNNWGTINYQNIKTITKVDATTFLWQTQYFDGLGRVVQVHTNGESGNTIIASTTTFNNRGMVDRQYVSQDIASILTSYQSPDASWKYSTSTYDALGRVVTQTGADGTSISHDHSVAWQDTVTNQRGFKTRFLYDAFQRLVKVEELNASHQLYATTTYYYDILGNLIEVYDNNNNTTVMLYDWLSRKTAMSDPDMGVWSYGYDNNGNLVTQTDAKSQTITMTYDALNRLVSKVYPVGSNMTNVYYVYDSTAGGNYGKGLRTSMTDASGNTTYVYDNRGRLVQETRVIDSIAYITSFTYDGANRPVTITYPTGEVVTQTYNGQGLPYSLSGSAAGNLVTGTYYNNLGSLTEIDFGNGLKTTYGYYDMNGINDTTGGYYGKLWEIKTLPQVGGDALQDVQHTWDAAGNLVTREDKLNSITENFEYDFLDRLVSGYTGEKDNWLTGWANRVKITIASSQLEGDPINIPVLIHISASCGQGGQDLTAIFDELGANYKKLAVTTDDGQTQLYVVVEKWDAVNEDALLRVSKEGWQISSSEDTIIYLYFDNTHEDNSSYVIGEYFINFSVIESRLREDITIFSFSEIESRPKANVRAILDKKITGPTLITGVMIGLVFGITRDGGSASGNYTESYTYNEIGNIMSRNGVTYTYGTKPHAVTSVGSMTYSYDANGNMITRGEQTLTWDAENRLIAVSGNGTTAFFICDSDGNRVKKLENGETTIYVNKYYEKNLTTGNVTTSYYLGGRLVATKENEVLRYVHQDHLTGTSLMTDNTGAQIGETMKYLPFGETLSGALPTDKKFTGQRLDATGLYCYGARYYDATIGRFTSADTVVQSYINPQSLNRYSYTFNNPLRYIDPSGNIVEIGGVDVRVTETVMSEGAAGCFIPPDLASSIVDAAESPLYQAYETLSAVEPQLTDYLETSDLITSIGIDTDTRFNGVCKQPEAGASGDIAVGIRPEMLGDSDFLVTLLGHELFHAAIADDMIHMGFTDDWWLRTPSIANELLAYSFQNRIGNEIGYVWDENNPLHKAVIAFGGVTPVNIYSRFESLTQSYMDMFGTSNLWPNYGHYIGGGMSCNGPKPDNNMNSVFFTLAACKVW
ncbi:MAG: hypothetical protein JW845_03485 [Dehalococcoidales bacterium]|nr:hypothetical protein [Dehalococcoidales bacterium]